MKSKGINNPLCDIFVSTLEFGDKELSGEQHVHRELQILAGRSGMLEIRSGTVKFNLRVGDVMLIKNSVPHSAKPILPFTTTASIKLGVGAILPTSLPHTGEYLYSTLSHFDKDYIYLRREDEKTAKVFSNVNKICEEAAKNDKSAPLFVEGYSKILLGILQRQDLLKSRIHTLDANAVTKLSPALSFVEKNCTKEISLEEIAKTLDMNREYFCRLFKKTVGITFVDYTNLVRITKAKELLISSQKSIQDISDDLGFSSVSYFTRVFKNITNQTPSTYRNIKIF